MGRDGHTADPNILNTSLRKIAQGSVIIFVGSIVSMGLAFVGRILFARYFTTSGYGFFSLGFTIVSISMVIGTLGLKDGATRQIAYYVGQGEDEKVKSVMMWSILLGVIAGSLIFICIFVFSDSIAVRFFDMPAFAEALKIFSVAIPFYILMQIFTSIFRGFKRVRENIYFLSVGRNLLFVVFLIPVIWWGFSFEWGVMAFVFSVIVTCGLFVIWFVNKIPFDLHGAFREIEKKAGKELLVFSLPLLLVMILTQVMGWTDTFMLGFFKTADMVGFYNAALPLGTLISSALGSIRFIYTPVISDFYAQRKMEEMKRSYAVLTKWLTAATVPLALIFVLFPETVLGFFFGHRYITAAIALQILAVGYFINNLMGPDGATLLAMGKTRFLMYATSVAACMNIGLNVILIPRFGIAGAASATVISMVSLRAIRVFKLYSLSKIHSLTMNTLKPLIMGCFLVLIVYLITSHILTIAWWMLPILFILFILLYIISLFLTKSFVEEDVDMILNIEKKTGLNLSKIRYFIRKFII